MSSRIIRASEESRKVGRFKFNPAPIPLAAGAALPAAPPEESRNAPGPESPGTLEEPAAPERESELNLGRGRMTLSEIEREAYEKGFSEGQRTGSEASAKAAESLLQRYSVSLEELNKLRREVFSSSEREVIKLALEIARKIIRREVSIDEELILTLVKVALNRVAHQSLVTIRVNPKDYLSIERHHAAQPEAGPLDETTKLVEDSSIERGGCVVESENGTTDARIEEQLREIEKGFFE